MNSMEPAKIVRLISIGYQKLNPETFIIDAVGQAQKPKTRENGDCVGERTAERSPRRLCLILHKITS